MCAASSPPPAASLSRTLRRRFETLSRMSPLAREITLVLILKFLLLWLLWHAFFSQPVARHMRMDPARVGQQLLHAPAPQDSAHAQH